MPDMPHVLEYIDRGLALHACIFNPHTRPVEGSRVAQMVRDTKDAEGASVVCHSTLYKKGVKHAVCRGWYDRFAQADNTFRLAQLMGVIEEQEPA